jgi:uncharacterized protein
MAGQFFWYDVMTTDTDRAAQFYSEVVGWNTQDASVDGKEYTMFTVNGHGVAGLMPIPEEAAKHGVQPAWMGYIEVADVDAAAEELKRQGGTLHRPPVTVPGVIRFGVVSDPQGAGFLIAQALGKTPMAELPNGTAGTIGWRELYARDGNAALASYQAMFGWTRGESFDMGEMGTYQLFATGGDAVGGMMTMPPSIPHPFWGYYITVPGIDAATTRVTASGGTVVMGPHQVPGGKWILQGRDPQGAYFSLISANR